MVDKHHTTFFKFNFISLRLKYLKKFRENFLKSPASIIQIINISFDIIEFCNGIYFISTDNFVKTTSFFSNVYNTATDVVGILDQKYIKTLNYYPKTYKHKKTLL
jgi:hypothetical protein